MGALPSMLMGIMIHVVFWLCTRGGYENGNADLDGNYLIDTSSKDIIFVALQYRLGLFGFLPGKAVKQGGDLNVGLCM